MLPTVTIHFPFPPEPPDKKWHGLQIGKLFEHACIRCTHTITPTEQTACTTLTQIYYNTARGNTNTQMTNGHKTLLGADTKTGKSETMSKSATNNSYRV
jgi:hypothetical protein